ncbi:4Fe-4S binding domain-containing protein [Draconibacterium orientale]|uniref:4Fe-4S binding domain-containing protein n=1 Tax=Draconibacterium orientale TaxID=1168034 RepID=X5DYU7_9BACT|nr:4Fe-4S binding protein [Draconibacterium orientale]AHW59481.1 4Fe-4S ferredoxin [Draconibacterium orientale]SES88599.1 4Fe-4S binding domain-containing protein [Draconibacterium orientale]
MIREIIKIDDDLCNGCGNCVPNCHEGALQIIDGKARLISELMCDGLGACIGHCPEGAITIEKREADAYDEIATISQMVKQGKATMFAHLKHLQDHNETGYLQQALGFIKANHEAMPFEISEVHELLHGAREEQTSGGGCATGGCPGSAPMAFDAGGLKMAAPAAEVPSELTQWPVQMHLINPAASYFQGADLLVAADCAGFAYGNFHNDFIKGRKMVIACPKLDQGTDIYVQKLVKLIDESRVNTITVVIMEVPCCGGLSQMVKMATQMASRKVPVKEVVIGIKGDVLSEEWV